MSPCHLVTGKAQPDFLYQGRPVSSICCFTHAKARERYREREIQHRTRQEMPVLDKYPCFPTKSYFGVPQNSPIFNVSKPSKHYKKNRGFTLTYPMHLGISGQKWPINLQNAIRKHGQVPTTRVSVESLR